jgi:hypothetical protein
MSVSFIRTDEDARSALATAAVPVPIHMLSCGQS